MALYTTVEEDKRAAILLLSFEASTGYDTKDLSKCLFHNQTKANATLKKLMADARKLGATWATGTIVELFRDKDSGQFLPAVGHANMTMAFGAKPRG